MPPALSSFLSDIIKNDKLYVCAPVEFGCVASVQTGLGGWLSARET